MTRPPKGLLGGMLALPSGEWAATSPDPIQPFEADWQTIPDTVRHTFTHFHLVLQVHFLADDQTERPLIDGASFLADFNADHMPSVFQKAWRLATA